MFGSHFPGIFCLKSPKWMNSLRKRKDLRAKGLNLGENAHGEVGGRRAAGGRDRGSVGRAVLQLLQARKESIFQKQKK